MLHGCGGEDSVPWWVRFRDREEDSRKKEQPVESCHDSWSLSMSGLFNMAQNRNGPTTHDEKGSPYSEGNG